jgi:hypothetical protein
MDFLLSLFEQKPVNKRRLHLEDCSNLTKRKYKRLTLELEDQEDLAILSNVYKNRRKHNRLRSECKTLRHKVSILDKRCAALIATYEAQIATKKRDCDALIADIVKERNKLETELKTKSAADTRDAIAFFQRQCDADIAIKVKEIERLMNDVRLKHEQELADCAKQHDAEIADLQTKYSDECDIITSEITKSVFDAQVKCDAEIIALTKEHEKNVAVVRAAYDETIRVMDRSYGDAFQSTQATIDELRGQLSALELERKEKMTEFNDMIEMHETEKRYAIARLNRYDSHINMMAEGIAGLYQEIQTTLEKADYYNPIDVAEYGALLTKLDDLKAKITADTLPTI